MAKKNRHQETVKAKQSPHKVKTPKKNRHQETVKAKQSPHKVKTPKKNRHQENTHRHQETVKVKKTTKKQYQESNTQLKNDNKILSRQKACFSRHNSDILKNLTDTETDVLISLTSEFMTAQQIAVKRKTTRQAVNQIVGRLREKGIINAVNKRLDKTRPTTQGCQPTTHSIRLHAQEFNIKIIHKDERYLNQMQKSNSFILDGNRVLLYKNTIEVYSGQMFYGETAQASTSKSLVYWNRFMTKLETYLKIIILKDRYQNVKLVNAHYAEIHNEFSKDCNINAEKIKITTTDEGKLWFLIDNSFNLHEAETVHPQTAKHDIEKVTKHFNDIRDNDPPTSSEFMSLMIMLIKANSETAAGLNVVVNTLNTTMQQPKPPKKTKKQEVLWYVG